MTRSSFQRGFVSNPIRTRSGIVFEIRYRVRSGNGTWKHKSERLHGLEGKKAARAILEQKLREASIEVVPAKDLTMQDFVDQYWKSYMDRIEAKPSTRKSYGSILKHLLPSLGQLRLSQVVPLHIEQLVQERSKKVSAKTLLNELGLLQSIFSLAVENDLISRSPVRSKHKPKAVRTEKLTWTPEQIRNILAGLSTQHRALFTCMSLIGLRIGELLALTWSNVNFEAQTIKVQNSLWSGLIVRPKTEASVRVLYAGPLLMKVLRDHWTVTSHRALTDLVFCKLDGQAWNPDVLRKDVLYPVLDRLHIPRPARNSGFHRFRHSVGSFVNAETGNLKLAQKLLGHSRYETTANIYTHSTSDQDREAAVAVEQAIFGESVRNVRENTNNKDPEVIN
jgi:integrase